MSFCPNCGTENNGGKFCCNCGTPLPVEQPVQPAQPEVAPQTASEPVQPQVIEQPVQPVAQPVAQPVSAPAPAPQPVMEPVAAPVAQPAAEPVAQPVYQAPVENVYAQSVAPDADAQKTNGMCKVGFILSLVGIVTAGITSLFGLIFSIVGIIGASKKKEKGKGMAIAGIIISAVILLCVGLFFSLIANEFNEAFNDLGISSVDIDDDDDDDDDDDNDDSSDYVEFIESKNWIETHADSYIVFERKNNFKYYETYADTTNNYFSGKYELYTGSKAIEVITEDYEEAGLTKDEIEDLLDSWDVDQKYFVCLVFNNDGCWVDGENTNDENWTTVYVGVLQEKPDVELYLLNVSSATEYLFVPEEDFDYPETTTTTEATQTSETTTATTSETTQSTAATSDYSGYEAVGDNVAGYVYLTQGTWEVWADASISSSDFDAVYSRINTDTMTIFNLTVYSGQYQEASLGAMADSLKDGMESDTGYTNISVEETTVCGYKAYSIRGLYQDGMWLNVWIFVDNNGKLHYNSIEYFENDVASYNMFVETYTLNR